MLKNIFTKEMITNAVVTLGVVMVGLAVHDKFVRPRIMASNGNGNAGKSASSTPEIAPVEEEA